MGLVLTLGLLTQLVLRIIYNRLSAFKIPFDPWDILSAICMVMSILCFYSTFTLTVEIVLDQERMRVIDYYVAVTIVLQWIRLFG